MHSSNELTLRDKSVLRIITIEGLVNFLILVVKITVGLSTGSFAILGDALHSLTDLGNNIMAWIILRLSSAPPDEDHPYGHRKFETLAVFLLATLLTVVAFEIFLNAFKKVEADVTSTKLELGLMIGVLLVNIVLSFWQKHWANKLNSQILIADADHTFADVLTTLVVIFGWQFSVASNYIWIDKLIAIVIAIFITYLAYKLFKKTIPILVDQVSIEPDKLKAAIEKIEGVNKAIRVRSRWIGDHKSVDVTVIVNASLSTKESHMIADKVESELEKNFDVFDTTIHIET